MCFLIKAEECGRALIVTFFSLIVKLVQRNPSFCSVGWDKYVKKNVVVAVGGARLWSQHKTHLVTFGLPCSLKHSFNRILLVYNAAMCIHKHLQCVKICKARYKSIN